MKRLIFGAAMLCIPVNAFAQVAPIPPVVRDFNGNKTTATAIVCVRDPAANPVVLVACGSASVAAATSTPQLGTVTSSTATATSGTATFAAGVATIGPLTPQLGRPIRVVLKGTWSGTIYAGTSTDGCANINPLTIGGQPWASFTGNANEDIDMANVAGVVYCARATIASGTLTYGVQQ
ncbi:hypothetical protein U1872_06250 [Sphingomonas sp. RB3P16]|uniref:hypothetical protein n=1 Tax=Parasphingomonas frigoris TaxID=3096163 RepID=UPI002FCA7193